MQKETDTKINKCLQLSRTLKADSCSIHTAYQAEKIYTTRSSNVCLVKKLGAQSAARENAYENHTKTTVKRNANT